MSAPSKRRLEVVERELRKRTRGSQRAVGGGIYMRLDAAGRRRFQFRLRSGAAQPGATYDSFEEAQAERRKSLTELETQRELGVAGPLTSDLRRMKLRMYARDHWWKSVEVDLDTLTQLSYRRHLKAHVLPLIGDVTLAQLDPPLIVDEFKRRLVVLLTYPDGHRRAGQLPRSTCDHALTVASSICTHAVNRGIISRNPFIGIVRFGQQRTQDTKGGRSNYRRVKPSEIMHPRTVAQAAAGMTGTWRQVEERRAVIDLLGFAGLRPSDICAARHEWWRDENRAKRLMTVDEAIKDVAGHLEPGEPKTGRGTSISSMRLPGNSSASIRRRVARHLTISSRRTPSAASRTGKTGERTTGIRPFIDSVSPLHRRQALAAPSIPIYCATSSPAS